jgi:hypothetical protein
MVARISRKEREQPLKNARAAAFAVIAVRDSPVPKEFQPYNDNENGERERYVDSPSYPKGPLEAPPGQQRERENRQLKSQAVEVLATIRIHRGEANSRIDVDQTRDGDGTSGQRPNGEGGRSRVGAPE